MTKPVQIPPAALEAMLDNVRLQIWQVSYDCTYGRVNAAHAAFFGKTRDQVEKQPVEMVLPQPEASTAITKIRNAFETKHLVEYEQWLKDTTGTKRLFHIRLVPTTDELGVIQSLTCTAEDITLIQDLDTELKLCREGADEAATEKIGESVDAVWGAVSSLVHKAETLDESASHHLKRLSESCRVVASVLSFNSVYSQDLDTELKLCREGADEAATEKIGESVDAVWGAVSTLVHKAETLDENASQHLKRLSESCRVVASVLSFNSVYSQNLDYNFIHMLQQACLLHDIGKADIPDSILQKPGKLTREEFDEVKKHTTNAADTLLQTMPHLSKSAMFQMTMDIALSHHERWDGKGYPNGLKGDEIPLSAQIVAICDVYDALRSVRPYKPALTHEVSLMELRRECGTQFNPALCDAFFRCAEDVRLIYDSNN